MYEGMTFDAVMERMLDRVPDGMDKREGAVIYDALAPAAMELARLYAELDYAMDQCFADTASREYLARRAAERGIAPREATRAVLKARATPADAAVPDGARFSLDELDYAAISDEGGGVHLLECETPGADGGRHRGLMTPIDYISGLERMEAEDAAIPGEDEEGTEELRERYMRSFESKAYGGNKEDYREKADSIAGVGATRVTPCWQGGGTVRLTILDGDCGKASAELVEKVQGEIDPRQDGMGDGVAPIGHIVTVDAAEEVAVNVSSKITLDSGRTWEGLKGAVEAAIGAYLLSLRRQWEGEERVIVRRSQIDNAIINVEGVADVQETRVNGEGAGNLELTPYQIPVMGEVERDGGG